MIQIEMKGDFGTTLYQKREIMLNPGDIVNLKCPVNGYLYIKNKTDNVSNEYNQDVVLENEKHFLKKGKEKNYIIYFISNSLINCKGYTSVQFVDYTYGDVDTNVNISYDYKIKVAVGRTEEFIQFVLSNGLFSAANGSLFQKKLNIEINAILKEFIGKKLKDTVPIELESNSLNISNNMIKILNSNSSTIYDWGFSIEYFAFNIVEDYTHHETKKKYKYDKIISGE